jgi:hypothetical protein
MRPSSSLDGVYRSSRELSSRYLTLITTALLVDISRAGGVNRRDLAEASRAGRLAGAAMDLCDLLSVSFRRAATMSVENILNYFREPATSSTRTRLKFRARGCNRVANPVLFFPVRGPAMSQSVEKHR